MVLPSGSWTWIGCDDSCLLEHGAQDTKKCPVVPVSIMSGGWVWDQMIVGGSGVSLYCTLCILSYAPSCQVALGLFWVLLPIGFSCFASSQCPGAFLQQVF